jgi:hypothetical protein
MSQPQNCLEAIPCPITVFPTVNKNNVYSPENGYIYSLFINN